MHDDLKVFDKSHLSVLICFICGCKHVHYSGYNMFGNVANKGTIHYCGDSQWLKKLFTEKAGEEPNASVSYSAFQKLYGDAVANDPFLQKDSSEWVRRIHRSGQKLLCCPEDVQLSTECKHPANEICLRCKVPICHECRGHIISEQHPPKPLTNDNFISYAHSFIVENKVTWLEATIACPIFTGLITYYMEGHSNTPGSTKGNRHLMDNPLAKPLSTVAVRGNVFSFLLPWDRVM